MTKVVLTFEDVEDNSFNVSMTVDDENKSEQKIKLTPATMAGEAVMRCVKQQHMHNLISMYLPEVFEEDTVNRKDNKDSLT